jgi:hypothetical protein
MTNESIKGSFHLNNGLRLNYTNRTLFKECFPVVWERIEVQNQIAKFEK